MVVNSGGSRKDLFRRDAQSEKVPGTSTPKTYRYCDRQSSCRR
jgi:hypothetical protein